MPVNDHLQWAEIKDFRPGLWTYGSSMHMPATAAQIMTDCYPMPAGGLRAALKPIAASVSGVSTGETVTGYFTLPGALGVDRYLWTQAGTTVKLYRMNSGAGEVTWTLRKTHAANSTGPVMADSFVDSTGATYVVYSMAGSGADAGVWSYTTSTNTVTQRLSGVGQVFVLCVQDDRIIVAVPFTGTVFANTLRWSDSQSVSSFPAANNLPIQVSRSMVSSIQTMLPIAPSDLLLGFSGTPWVLVEGDITNPIVRAMSDARTTNGAQKGVYTPDGLAFKSAESVFVTTDGRTFVDLADQINITDIATGQMQYLNRILTAGNGLTFDFDTRSWYKLGDVPAGNFGWGNVTNRLLSIVNGTSTTSFTIQDYFTSGDSRKNTYTWKSAPLRAPDGRQVEIREVQVYAETLDTNATITVTVNGTAHTVTIAAASKQQMSFLYVERGEVLDVQIVPAAGSGANEAPRIEAVRIGTGTGHLLG